ncbi:MAG TPA: hypothetical protein V6C81_16035 [Planktothrix sp.]
MGETDSKIAKPAGDAATTARHQTTESTGFFGAIYDDGASSLKMLTDAIGPRVDANKKLDFNSNVTDSTIAQGGLGSGVVHLVGTMASSVSLLARHPGIVVKAAQDTYHTAVYGTNTQRAALAGHATFFLGTMALGGGEAGLAKVANTADLAAARVGLASRETLTLTNATARAAIDSEILGVNSARIGNFAEHAESAMTRNLATTVEGLTTDGMRTSRILPRTGSDLLGSSLPRVGEAASRATSDAGSASFFGRLLRGGSRTSESVGNFSLGDLSAKPVLSPVYSVSPEAVQEAGTLLGRPQALSETTTLARSLPERFTLRAIENETATAPAVRLGETATTPAVRLGETATAPAARLGETATAPAVRLGETATAPAARLGETATAPAAQLGEVTAPRLGTQTLGETSAPAQVMRTGESGVQETLGSVPHTTDLGSGPINFAPAAALPEAGLTETVPVGQLALPANTDTLAARAVARTTEHAEQAVTLANQSIEQLPQSIKNVTGTGEDAAKLDDIASRLGAGKVTLTDPSALRDVQSLVDRLSPAAREQVTQILRDTSADIRDANLFESGVRATTNAADHVQSFTSNLTKFASDAAKEGKPTDLYQQLDSYASRLVPGRDNGSLLEKMEATAQQLESPIKESVIKSLNDMSSELGTAQRIDRSANLLRAGIKETEEFQTSMTDLAQTTAPQNAHDAQAIQTMVDASKAPGGLNSTILQSMRDTAATIEDPATQQTVLRQIKNVETPLQIAEASSNTMHQVEDLTRMTSDMQRGASEADQAVLQQLGAQSRELSLGSSGADSLKTMRETAEQLSDAGQKQQVLKAIEQLDKPLTQAQQSAQLVRSSQAAADFVNASQSAATQMAAHVNLQLDALTESTSHLAGSAVGQDVTTMANISQAVSDLPGVVSNAERVQKLTELEQSIGALENTRLQTAVKNSIDSTIEQLNAADQLQATAATSRKVVQQINDVSGTLDQLATRDTSGVVENLARQSRMLPVDEANTVALTQMKNAAATITDAALKNDVTQAIERLESSLTEGQTVQRTLNTARESGIIGGDTMATATTDASTTAARTANSVVPSQTAAQSILEQTVGRTINASPESAVAKGETIATNTAVGTSAGDSTLQMFRGRLTQDSNAFGSQVAQMAEASENAPFQSSLRSIAQDASTLTTAEDPAAVLAKMKGTALKIADADVRDQLTYDIERMETRLSRAQQVQDSLVANAKAVDAAGDLTKTLDRLTPAGDASASFDQLKSMMQAPLRDGETYADKFDSMRTAARDIDQGIENSTLRSQVLNSIDRAATSYADAERAQVMSNAAVSSEKLTAAVETAASQPGAQAFERQLSQLTTAADQVSVGANNKAVIDLMRDVTTNQITEPGIKSTILDAVNEAERPLLRAQQVQDVMPVANQLSLSERFTQAVGAVESSQPEIAARFPQQFADLKAASSEFANGEANATTVARMRNTVAEIGDDTVKAQLTKAIDEAEAPLSRAQRLQEFAQAQTAAQNSITDLTKLSQLPANASMSARDADAIAQMQQVGTRLTAVGDNAAALRALRENFEALSPDVAKDAQPLVTNVERSLANAARAQEAAAAANSTESLSQQLVRNLANVTPSSDAEANAVARLQDGAAALRYGADNGTVFTDMSKTAKELSYADQLRTERAISDLQSAYATAQKVEAVAASADRADMAVTNLNNAVRSIGAVSAEDAAPVQAFKESVAKLSPETDNTQALNGARTALNGMSNSVSQQLTAQLQAAQDALLVARTNLFDFYGDRVAQNVSAITAKDSKVPLAERIAQTQQDIAIMRSVAPLDSQTSIELANLSHNVEAVGASVNLQNSSKGLSYLKDWYFAYGARLSAQVKRAESALAAGNDAQAQAIVDQMVLTGRASSRAGMRALEGSSVQGLASERAQFWATQEAIRSARLSEKARDIMSGWVEGLSAEKQDLVRRAIEKTLLAKQDIRVALNHRVLYNRATIAYSLTSPFVGPAMHIAAPYLKPHVEGSKDQNGDSQTASGNGNGADTTVVRKSPEQQVAQADTREQTAGGGGQGDGREADGRQGDGSTPSNQATFSRSSGSGLYPTMPDHSIGISFASSPADAVWLMAQHANIPWYGAVQSIFPVDETQVRPIYAQQAPIKFTNTNNTTDQSKISTTQFDYGKISQLFNQNDLLTDARFNRFAPMTPAIGAGSSLATSWAWMGDMKNRRPGVRSASGGDPQHNLDMLEATIEHRDGAPVAGGTAPGNGSDPNQPAMVGAAASTTDPSGTHTNQDPQTVQAAAAQTAARQTEEA